MNVYSASSIVIDKCIVYIEVTVSRSVVVDFLERVCITLDV